MSAQTLKDWRLCDIGAHLSHMFGQDTDPVKLQGAEDIVLDGLRGSDLRFMIAASANRTGYACVDADRDVHVSLVAWI